MSARIVIFDLDDTLYAERDFALAGFEAAALAARTRWGIDDLAADMTRLLDEGHLGGLFKLALEARLGTASAEDAAHLLSAYKAHRPVRLSLFEDAAWVLDHYAPQARLGLVTDGDAGVQAAKVAALGIAPRFAHIVYTGAYGGREFHKPHPRAFHDMARQLAADPADLVYVGDNPAKDFVAPNALGWRTVQIVRGDRIHAGAATAEGGAAQVQIHSLRDLPAVLTS